MSRLKRVELFRKRKKKRNLLNLKRRLRAMKEKFSTLIFFDMLFEVYCKKYIYVLVIFLVYK